MKRMTTLLVALLIMVSGAMAQKQYKVGDYYNENGRAGVVFQVDETGQHGKIVSLNEPNKLLIWCYDSYDKGVEWGAFNNDDGAANMVIILKQVKNLKKYPAISWCLAQGKGWYLPAINELKTLLLDNDVHSAVNKTLIEHGGIKLISVGEKTAKNGFARDYWSSTEEPYFYNRYQDNSFSNVTNRIAKAKCIRMRMKQSSCIYEDKTIPLRVRAIAVF